ncbi:MAG: response regulator [Candidatus Aureabacteria bacterium]|nr:response regulator [Candidatus Auribacterota bacterium]
MAKILIVDDSPTIIDLLKTVLASHDHEVMTANDGITGLNLAKEIMPDLIILDIMLPKMNGYEVCNLIKFDEKYKGIKILMLTAKAGAESKNIGFETGADEYMTKDLDPDKILQAVTQLLQKK